ncbi:MAG: AI-2E family transporter [Actinomycetes bacterium]
MTTPDAPTVTTEWSIPRGLIILLGGAGIFVVMFGLQSFQGIVGPTFLALMLVITMVPLQHWMIRKHWPRWLAITTMVLGAYAILVSLGLVLLYAGAKFASLVAENAPSGDAITKDAQNFLSNLGIGQKQIDAATGSLSPQNVATLVTDVLSSLSSVAGSLFLVLAVIIFLGLDSLGFTDRLRYTAKSRPDISDAMSNFASGTRTYLAVSTIFGGIVAVIDTIALYIMGIPAPILWGFVAFVTNYIPNIGFVIGVIPPAVLGLLVGGWKLAILVVVVYSVINFLIQSIIQPKFVGDSVNLATTVTFLSMAIWTLTIGPLGALLAVPLTLLTKAILIDLDPSTRWIGTLLGSTTPSEDDDAPPGQEPITPAIVDQSDE